MVKLYNFYFTEFYYVGACQDSNQYVLPGNGVSKICLQYQFNLLNTKRNLPYIRNQSVPRSKLFPPRLYKNQSANDV